MYRIGQSKHYTAPTLESPLGVSRVARREGITEITRDANVWPLTHDFPAPMTGSESCMVHGTGRHLQRTRGFRLVRNMWLPRGSWVEDTPRQDTNHFVVDADVRPRTTHPYMYSTSLQLQTNQKKRAGGNRRRGFALMETHQEAENRDSFSADDCR